MDRRCTVLSILHLLVVSFATLVSSFVIEAILWSGAICMVVAMVGLVCSLSAKRYWLTTISLCTLGVGAFFIVFELIFYVFGGPENAALPLCLIFLGVQGFAIFATISDLNSQSEGPRIKQITIWQLLIATTLFAVSFGVMENFPVDSVPYISDWSVAFKYSWLVSLSLAMFLLTIFGLSAWYTSTNTLPNKNELDS